LGLRLIIAAYFALVATVFVAGVVALSVEMGVEASGLDNAYLSTP
jgi:hypothetical protein